MLESSRGKGNQTQMIDVGTAFLNWLYAKPSTESHAEEESL